MAQIQSRAYTLHPRPSTPPQRPLNAPLLSPSRMPESYLSQQSYKNGHLNLDLFSPVDQNGSFCFDRVIKSGKVQRRVKKKGAWKPSWKPAYLVLRPNLLSIYSDADETDLRASITLSDVTAVASVQKSHMKNVFGVFSPAKNHHFQGVSDTDTADWIAQIRLEIGTDEHDELDLPAPQFARNRGDSRGNDSTDLSADESPDVPGSPELPHWPVRGKSRSNTQTRPTGRRSSNLQEYSGNELMNTSHSDFSDFQPGSLPKNVSGSLPIPSILTPIASNPDLRPALTTRNTSQLSITQQQHPSATHLPLDPERVIRQGWLLILKSHGSVRQWKSMWAVLRPKNLCLYKNAQEYSAVKILSMHSIINAAEVDPISKSKRFCFQIIADEKTYRFCADGEEELDKWLGALKSVLSKRAEKGKEMDAERKDIKEKGKGGVEVPAGMAMR